MALETYRNKRKFGVTAEPRGRQGRRAGNRFVIQKHAARRLHYDLRLELDGVMKSWAVTRGPSLDPGEKRLAVQVEDHPIEYNTFEGTIPDGEYGGGTVMIWDRGRWNPDGDPHKGFANGHLVFDLDGEKLHGRWHLVRMHGRAKERHDNWLLIKSKDDDARTGRRKDVLEELPRSVVSGRSIEEIAAGEGKKRVWHSNRATADTPARKQQTAKRAGARTKAAVSPATRKTNDRATLPDFVPPSLATLHSSAPSGADWLHEIKFDGYRIEARLDRGEVTLLTRNRQDWTHRFKPIADAVAALPATTALLDGELVVENEKGISSFSMLQTDLKDDRSDRFVYWVFDLLHLDGRDLMQAPLVERKAALERLLKKNGRTGKIRYTEHFEEDGAIILKHACGMGLEGVISKRSDALYRSGRSENFIKSKCHNRQEFVVAGFSPAAAMPRAVGALTVAFHEQGKLRYAGRVGTGYTHKTARDLWKRLEGLQIAKAPVALPPDERRKNVRWVKPQLVVEIEFRGVTHDGLLRQASYKGLREDKPARDVVREAAEPAADQAAMAQRQTVRKSSKPDVKPASKSNAAGANQTVEVGHVRLTHSQRVYWPDVGVTKKDLADYYADVWDWIAPHIVGRALSLVRAPAGVGGETFFQKHIASNIKSSPLRRVVAGKEHDVIAVVTRDDLVALIQTAALEIHVRGSRLDSLETCDRIVFDLDPGEGVSWTQMIAAARETRERLKAEQLESFVKLSGGKGLHVVAPIADADWDAAKAFTQRMASAMAVDSPKLYLAKMTKSLRRGRIFIDYFRNSREATSVAPYSTRARDGAPVSAPVTWDKLGRTTGGNQFTLLDLKKHFKNDPWAAIGKVRQKLPAVAKRRR